MLDLRVFFILQSTCKVPEVEVEVPLITTHPGSVMAGQSDPEEEHNDVCWDHLPYHQHSKESNVSMLLAVHVQVAIVTLEEERNKLKGERSCTQP